MKRKYIRHIICAAFVVAGIVFLCAGMNPFRASFFIVFGVLAFLMIYYDAQKKGTSVTPRGFRFWLEKELSGILSFTAVLSLCNGILNHVKDMTDVLIWLVMCIAGGLLLGTVNYIVYSVNCSEEEFEAREKRLQEIGDQYDKAVGEMKSGKES